MPHLSKTSKKKKKPVAAPIPWTTPATRGFLILTFAILLLLSLISFAAAPDSKNLIGRMGDTLGWIFHTFFGLSSYPLVVYIGWMGWRLLFDKPLHFLWLKHLYVASGVFSFSMLLSLVEIEGPSLTTFLTGSFYPGLWEKHRDIHLGGIPFFYLYYDLPALNLHRLFNTVGTALIFSSLLISSLLFLFKIHLGSLYRKGLEQIKKGMAYQRTVFAAVPSLEEAEKKEEQKKTVPKSEESPSDSDFLRFVKLRIPTHSPSSEQTIKPSPSDLLAIQPEKNPKERPSLSRKEQNDQEEERSFLNQNKKKEEPSTLFQDEENDRHPFKKPIDPLKKEEKGKKKDFTLPNGLIKTRDFSSYALPTPSLLSQAKKVDQSSLKKDLKRQAEVLEETLLSFGIEAKVGQINCGPTITSFEVHPAIGVKVQRIKALDNDIALNMEARSIRIIAPIPGKAAVGIEVPNAQPQEVSFKEMLLAYQQSAQKFHIPVLLGQAVNGDYVMSDLTKMPHCIIAGATGSGKSVCINTLVMSIVLNAKPDQVKLVMVDPKKVELTPYTHLPHMLAPVITEPQGAAAALNWLVKEMENRYDILKLVGTRNIDSFNKRTIDQEREASLGREIPLFMPFIVGIIDELADLMMVANQDIETPIARIAQMARAVGIHLVLATQRPSREVITGLIKANFPTRISFKVASRVNSQIVLDEVGAESLLGNGDMLFLPPGSSHLVRAQGAFIRDDDIQAVIKFISEQSPPQYVIQSFDHMQEWQGGEQEEREDPSTLDSLYEQAKEIILKTGNASTTFLQRKLKIGYARAASLMDLLEREGVVGPAEGSKPRKIFHKEKELAEEDQEKEEDEEQKDQEEDLR